LYARLRYVSSLVEVAAVGGGPLAELQLRQLPSIIAAVVADLAVDDKVRLSVGLPGVGELQLEARARLPRRLNTPHSIAY
jgi:hypothetical protein